MPSSTVEDYLKQIYLMQLGGPEGDVDFGAGEGGVAVVWMGRHFEILPGCY